MIVIGAGSGIDVNFHDCSTVVAGMRAALEVSASIQHVACSMNITSKETNSAS